jgi:hypothetical protein
MSQVMNRLTFAFILFVFGFMLCSFVVVYNRRNSQSFKITSRKQEILIEEEDEIVWKGVGEDLESGAKNQWRSNNG